jgi:hypothetical protein
MRADDLKLDEGSRAAVYRVLAAVLTGDPGLSRLNIHWDTGLPDAGRPRPPAISPLLKAQRLAIRTRPELGPAPWYSPDATLGDLVVVLAIEVDGTDVTVPLNLWQTIERALYPRDDAARLAIRQKLLDAGADTGEATFSVPPTDPAAAAAQANRQAFTGLIRLGVVTSLNP